MADRYKSIFITVIFSLSFISCVTQEMVIEKSLELLHKEYDAYAPVESGYVIESAFFTAEIERKNGNRAGSRKLYSPVADRIR